MKAYNAINWTDEMISYLKENHAAMTNQQLAAGLGLQVTSVRHKCYSLGLYKMRMEYWTAEQIAYLKANYQTKGDKELAELFTAKWQKDKGWDRNHMEKKRSYLKLKRTPEEIAAIRENHRLNGVYLEGNLKMWRARGCNPIGTVVIWKGQKLIKTKKGYIYLRIYNFKKYIGEIPPKHLVTHKDGDTLNCEPENLELMNRADNARRNTWSRYPPEYRKALWNVHKLNNLINKKSKQWQETNSAT